MRAGPHGSSFFNQRTNSHSILDLLVLLSFFFPKIVPRVNNVGSKQKEKKKNPETQTEGAYPRAMPVWATRSPCESRRMTGSDLKGLRGSGHMGGAAEVVGSVPSCCGRVPASTTVEVRSDTHLHRIASQITGGEKTGCQTDRYSLGEGGLLVLLDDCGTLEPAEGPAFFLALWTRS